MKLFVASIALLLSAPAAAVAVPVINAGFDARTLSDGGFTFGNSLGGGFGGGWFGRPGADNSGLYNPEAGVVGAVPSEGNVAYAGTGIDSGGAYSGSFSQRLAADVAAGTRYTLSVDVGRRGDGVALADFVVELLDGFKVLASGTFAQDDIAAGTFRTLSFAYDSTAADTGPLGVRFTSVYNAAQGNDYRQVLFDDVRLDATRAVVPEPATWATLALGFALVGGAARRRRISRRAC